MNDVLTFKLEWYIYLFASILCWIGTFVVWYACIIGIISCWGNAIICTILDCALAFLLIKFRIKISEYEKLHRC